MNRERANLIGKPVSMIFTTKYTCTACSRSFTIFRNESGDGVGECEHCGCTSYHLSDGRPWGRRHRYWNDWVRSLYSLDENDRITRETIHCFYDASEYGQFLVLGKEPAP